LEKLERDAEKEANTRPCRRLNRNIKKIGTVTKTMQRTLDKAMKSKSRVTKQERREDALLYFELDASAGGYHAVKIGQLPGCTCEEYKYGGPKGSATWVHCRHIYAIMYKGLGVTWETEKSKVALVHQSAFTLNEAKRICAQPFDEVAMSGSKSG
jgi:hypothetical protein